MDLGVCNLISSAFSDSLRPWRSLQLHNQQSAPHFRNGLVQYGRKKVVHYSMCCVISLKASLHDTV